MFSWCRMDLQGRSVGPGAPTYCSVGPGAPTYFSCGFAMPGYSNIRGSEAERKDCSYCPKAFVRKAITSAEASINFTVGVPAPCPARVSIRIKTGLVPR